MGGSSRPGGADCYRCQAKGAAPTSGPCARGGGLVGLVSEWTASPTRAPAAQPEGVEMTRRRITGCVASFLVLVGALIPGVASGAPPTIERIAVDDTFVDEFLSEECGVE